MKAGDSVHADYGFQSGLFPGVKRKHFSRRSDSQTSSDAVRVPKIKGEAAMVLRAIEAIDRDFTARELHRHSRINYILISKRLSVLHEAKFITKSDKDDPNPEKRGTEMIWRRTSKKAVYL